MTASTGQQHTKHPTSLSQNARGFKGPVVHSSEFYKRFGESVESDGCSTNFGSVVEEKVEVEEERQAKGLEGCWLWDGGRVHGSTSFAPGFN